MFTGIVTDVGRIEAVEKQGDLRVVVATDYDTAAIDLGASVACSGVCLTVVDKAPGRLAFDVSAESVSRTADGMWTEGRRLNLERALRLGDELGGHIVTGHVDAVGTVAAVVPEGGSLRVTIEAPRDLAPYVAAKGSITVDGVSLTVNSVEDRPHAVRFGLNIIPHTAEVTTFADLQPGTAVNLEIDVLARYLQRMEQARAAT
ncbi:riboflavin synthase [Sphingomonas spermidinifaciens]|uniref:Riboflavin synthase n=1 Tax=Sphingomonas spermidinifaciens TaxID=1141889 RepID=A0A2A4B3W2_9SPHN|nr:riboflavin synthase [Sphingomonas spermidinifaciens]PCD02364.1 riboflavin synthase [Sphingomonas spermidinifaciens]